MQVTPSQLTTLLTAAIPARLPVMIHGKPGVGKTDIITSVCESIGADLILSHPAVEDPTVPAGLPWAMQGATEATFLPFGILARALKVTKPTVWFLDDFGQATPATQAAYMQFLLARRLNNHVLPDCLSFVIATNGRGDRANVSGILETVKSRNATIVELAPDLEQWCTWAFGANIPTTIIAFLRFRNELLSDFKPTADMSNSPMPRTWANLAKLEALSLPQQVELAAMSGAVGDGPASEYIAFRRMFQSLTSIDAILLDPKNCKLPTQPNKLYATVTALASKATPENLAQVGIIATRLMDSGKGDFSALLLRDCLRRNAKLQHTDTFVRIASGPVGQLLSGMENN